MNVSHGEANEAIVGDCSDGASSGSVSVVYTGQLGVTERTALLDRLDSPLGHLERQVGGRQLPNCDGYMSVKYHVIGVLAGVSPGGRT